MEGDRDWPRLADPSVSFLGLPCAPPAGFQLQQHQQQVIVPSAPPQEDLVSVYGLEVGEDFHDGEALTPIGPAAPMAGFTPYSPTWAAQEHGLDASAHRGVLFVGVLQCRGLLSAKHKAPDPYARVTVVPGTGEKPKPLESARLKNSSEPKFFCEFTFAISSDVGSLLQVQIYDHRAIGFDTLLGEVHVPIESLPAAAECRFYPLERGEVELFLAYTRCDVSPRAPPQQELPALRIVSERSNYFAGELVRGVVTFCVSGSPLDVYNVTVGAIGRVR
jgi:hypothetical protein